MPSAAHEAKSPTLETARQRFLSAQITPITLRVPFPHVVRRTGTPEFITLNSTGKDVFVADRFYGCVDGQLYGVATSPSGSYH